jgi:hypothetical protein
MLGTYIVELHVPDDGSIRIELDNAPHGHSTFWAEVATIRAWIVAVNQA